MARVLFLKKKAVRRMANCTSRLIQYVLDLNECGFSVVPIDHDDDIINIEFENEGDVIGKMSQMASTMGVTQLGLVSYGVVGLMLNQRIYDLYDTLALINSEGSPIYIFKAPPSSYMMHSVHYSSDDDRHRANIERLSFTKKMARRDVSLLDIMFIANEVIHFRGVIDTKKPLLDLPIEIRSFLYKTESPVRQIHSESLATGCYLHTKTDLLPLDIETTKCDLVWKEMHYTTSFGRKRKSMHTQVRLNPAQIPPRLIEAAQRHIEVSRAKMVHFSHLSEWEVFVKTPTCIFFYGDEVDALLKTTEHSKAFEMAQGDMLFINNGKVVFKPEAGVFGEEEGSVFLLLQ